MKITMFTNDLENKENPYAPAFHNQVFECCGKTLVKKFDCGWEWSDGNIIPAEIAATFKYCPFCGTEIVEIEDNLDKTLN